MTTKSVKELLRNVLLGVPRHCVEHLKTNSHRLTRRTYNDGKPDGQGLPGRCLFGILFEPLPREQTIDSKVTFRRHYGQPFDKDGVPSKRWSDPSTVMNRFDSGELGQKEILEVVEEVLEATKPSRTAAEINGDSKVAVTTKQDESSCPVTVS